MRCRRAFSSLKEGELSPNDKHVGVGTRVIHLRERDSRGWISPKGGQTIVTITMGDLVVSGVAECSPKDNYNKKRGREIAEGRAWAAIRDLNQATSDALASQ